MISSTLTACTNVSPLRLRNQWVTPGCNPSSLISVWPTGVQVTLSIYGLHHNPKVWPNPEVGGPQGGQRSWSQDHCELPARVWPLSILTEVLSSCRCLTLPGLHRTLPGTATHSCPSREEQGEIACVIEYTVKNVCSIPWFLSHAYMASSGISWLVAMGGERSFLRICLCTKGG